LSSESPNERLGPRDPLSAGPSNHATRGNAS